MRQHRWLEFLATYDFSIEYTLGKRNEVANALTRKHQNVMLVILEEWNDLEALTTCSVQLRSTTSSSQRTAMLSCLEVRLVLIERIASK